MGASPRWAAAAVHLYLLGEGGGDGGAQQSVFIPEELLLLLLMRPTGASSYTPAQVAALGSAPSGRTNPKHRHTAVQNALSCSSTSHLRG